MDDLKEWWLKKSQPAEEKAEVPEVDVSVEVISASTEEKAEEPEAEKTEVPAVLKALTITNLISFVLSSAANEKDVDVEDLKKKVDNYITSLTKTVKEL